MPAAAPTQVRFDLFGEVRPLSKAAGANGWVPTRPLGGWIATYGQLLDDGTVQPTKDREGHVFEAAQYAPSLGRIDWSDYLRKGRWNDTHDPIYVGLPTGLEFHDATSELAKAHRKVGFWTEGHLFDRSDPRSWLLFSDYEPTEKDLQRADYYWQLATMLKGMPRPLGFSAHGKMLVSPCGERIIWARVEQNAVCEVPQNPDAVATPLRLAVPIRESMVGANPCATCRCPPGARCKTLAKAEKLVGGIGDGKPDDAFDEAELEAGIRHELEHTSDRATAKEIAKDHLTEDPHYYAHLRKGASAIHGGQFPMPDEVTNAANLVGQAFTGATPLDQLYRLLQERFGCSLETAKRWTAEYLLARKNRLRADPAEPQENP